LKASQGIIIETLRNNEKNFVIDSFLKSNLNKGINHLIPKDYYYRKYGKLIKYMLENSFYQADCIKLTSSPDLILGYIITSYQESHELSIHYLFVKFNYRKSGLAKALVESVMNDHKEFYTDNYPYKIDGKSKIKTEFMGYPFSYKPFIGI